MLLSLFLSRLQQTIAHRRTNSILRDLNDRTLDDLGLSRWEIQGTVNGDHCR